MASNGWNLTLKEAIPYIPRWAGKMIVVKLGGSTLGSEDTTLEDIAVLKSLGVNPVLVHGGGPEISAWVKRSGHEPNFVNGLRVTDEQTIEIVTMVLGGKINKQLVAGLAGHNCAAIGVSGVDGPILRGRIKNPDLGLVGEIASVHLDPVFKLIDAGFVPVIAPLALGENAEILNVNADTAAAEIAAAARAEKLVFLTDVAGVKGAAGELLSTLTATEVGRLIRDKVITGGMIPKVEACLTGLKGCDRAHIIDGRVPHALLKELYTDHGIGTMFQGEPVMA